MSWASISVPAREDAKTGFSSRCISSQTLILDIGRRCWEDVCFASSGVLGLLFMLLYATHPLSLHF